MNKTQNPTAAAATLAAELITELERLGLELPSSVGDHVHRAFIEATKHARSHSVNTVDILKLIDNNGSTVEQDDVGPFALTKVNGQPCHLAIIESRNGIQTVPALLRPLTKKKIITDKKQKEDICAAISPGCPEIKLLLFGLYNLVGYYDEKTGIATIMILGGTLMYQTEIIR